MSELAEWIDESIVARRCRDAADAVVFELNLTYPGANVIPNSLVTKLVWDKNQPNYGSTLNMVSARLRQMGYQQQEFNSFDWRKCTTT